MRHLRAYPKTLGDRPKFAAGTIAAMVAEQIGTAPFSHTVLG